MKSDLLRDNLRSKLLKNRQGFLIIKKVSDDPNKIKNLTFKISDSLGKRVEQSDKKNLYLKITPKTSKIKNKKNLKSSNLRYHETNFGGSIHTDGPQLKVPPKILVMSCVRNAKSGGFSIITNAKKIYNYIKQNSPRTLKILKKNFYFERRGFKKRGPRYFSSPIFFKKGASIIFRYLREYIESGHQLAKKKLNTNQIDAMNYLDKLLINKKFIKKYKLLSGDIIMLNNHIMAHGRSSFKLEKAKRLFIRTWIN